MMLMLMMFEVRIRDTKKAFVCFLCTFYSKSKIVFSLHLVHIPWVGGTEHIRCLSPVSLRPLFFVTSTCPCQRFGVPSSFSDSLISWIHSIYYEQSKEHEKPSCNLSSHARMKGLTLLASSRILIVQVSTTTP